MMLSSNGAAASLGAAADPTRGVVGRGTVMASTGTNWHVQLAQTLTLHAGMGYRLHRLAHADTTATVDVMLQQIADPYAVYFSQALTLTDAWQELTLAAGSNAADEPSSLTLMVGAAGQCTIDVDDFTRRREAGRRARPRPNALSHLKWPRASRRASGHDQRARAHQGSGCTVRRAEAATGFGADHALPLGDFEVARIETGDWLGAPAIPAPPRIL